MPNPEAVKAWATSNGKVDASGNMLPLTTLCADPELVKAVLADLQKQVSTKLARSTLRRPKQCASARCHRCGGHRHDLLAMASLHLWSIRLQGKSRGLQSFEIPKGLILEPVPWTPDDILTPSFKLKRRDAKEKYGAQLDALYAKLDSVAGKADLKQGTA